MEIDGRKVPVLRVSIEKRYRDENKQWRSTSSFSRSEVADAIYCLENAFHYMVGRDNAVRARGVDEIEKAVESAS